MNQAMLLLNHQWRTSSLEKHDERLKEALIKLRDLSQETEQEQRRRISEIERTLLGLTNSNVSNLSRLHSQCLSYGAGRPFAGVALNEGGCGGGDKSLVQVSPARLWLLRSLLV